MIYFLLITDIELSYDDFIHDFMIGAFDTEEKAMDTAEHYIKNIEGFNKYKCTYRVERKQFSDDMLIKTPKHIWIAQGWNENNNLDEVDIVESICATKEKAS